MYTCIHELISHFKRNREHSTENITAQVTFNTGAQMPRNAPAKRICQQHRDKQPSQLGTGKKCLSAAVWNLCAAQSPSGSDDLDKSPAGAQRPALC